MTKYVVQKAQSDLIMKLRADAKIEHLEPELAPDAMSAPDAATPDATAPAEAPKP